MLNLFLHSEMGMLNPFLHLKMDFEQQKIVICVNLYGGIPVKKPFNRTTR
jgi:hypothetical protein